jgi:hypothetical protein
MTLVVPSLWTELSAIWMPTTRSDPAVRALRDRHYSTKRPGGRTAGPPGEVVLLRTPDGLAAWISHYPRADLALDGLDAWRCTLFRNEGPRLSSDLIREAMNDTELLRSDIRPRDGWLTYVEPRKLRSTNPGYCFLAAGWRRDTTWSHPRLVRLIYP